VLISSALISDWKWFCPITAYREHENIPALWHGKLVHVIHSSL